jgi:hypothetical protein
VKIAKIFGLVLVERFLPARVVLAALNLRTVFEPHLPATVLNSVFAGVLPITSSLIADKAYVQNGTFTAPGIGTTFCFTIPKVGMQT